MRTIGEYYGEACGHQRDTVDYYGGEIAVLQNKWDDELQVTQTMPSVQGIDSKEGLRRTFHEAMTEMAVIESLGYDLDYCDDGVAFWSKAISE